MTALDKGFYELEVGDRFVTRGRTITEADVVAFASSTGDRHPQHTDAAWAALSRFGERVAHGLMVLSYAAGLVAFDPERVVALRRVRDVVFKRPVRIGDTIWVDGDVASLREIDAGHGLVECRWRVRNQDGRIVMRAAIDIVWRIPLDAEPDPELDRREPALMADARSVLPI